jgi:hypothetical protein
MKNTCKFLTFIAFAVLFTACQEAQKKQNQEEKNIKVEYKAPKQIISLEEADSLYVNYKKRRTPAIIALESENQDGKPFVPTEFVSFDIEVLKDYIGYVEQEAKNGGTKADSIRVYLGNYGNRSKKYKRKNTVFMLPTASVNGDYGGIYIDDAGNAKLVRNWVNEQQNGTVKGQQKAEASIVPTFSSLPNLQGGKSLALNFGNGGPPPKQDF